MTASPTGSTLEAADVERRTGWRVLAFPSIASTNDEAARVRDDGDADRVAIVADAQTAGRGRGGSAFVSPIGGLYASLLLRVPVADLPAPLVLATAVALAEAVEEAGRVAVAVKWPNDLWIAGKKVAGILVETASSPAGAARPGRSAAARAAEACVVIGVGVNLASVPSGLPPAVAAATTAVDLHAPAPVSREDLLAEFLPRLDARLALLREPTGRRALESDYRRRLALVGRPVRFFVGDAPRRGVLRDVSLDRGVLVESADGAPSWLAAEHVREMRPDGP